MPVNIIYMFECSFYQNLIFCLRKPFHIIHTRAQNPDIGSGACQYNIHVRMLFLPEPHILFTKTFFTLNIQGLRTLTLALVPVIGLKCPFYKKDIFCLRKPFHIIHTRAQNPDIGSGACQYNIHVRMLFLPEPHILLTKNIFTLNNQGLRTLTLVLVPVIGLKCPFYKKDIFCLRKPFHIIHTRAQNPDIGSDACHRT